MAEWTFLTNHALVLVAMAREPDTRMRHIAECVGITERAAHRIVSELIESGYLTRHRLGRRSFYEVHADQPLRDPLAGERTVGETFRTFLQQDHSAVPLRA
jgi:hypothetical protein